MSAQLEDSPERTTVELVKGILVDLQHLVEQQLLLTRRELEQEFHKRSTAVGMIAGGLGVLFLDAVVLCLSLAHLMHWMASPPGTDPSSLPLWACHALIAVVLSGLCATLFAIGRSKLAAVDTRQILLVGVSEESVPWTTNRK